MLWRRPLAHSVASAASSSRRRMSQFVGRTARTATRGEPANPQTDKQDSRRRTDHGHPVDSAGSWSARKRRDRSQPRGGARPDRNGFALAALTGRNTVNEPLHVDCRCLGMVVRFRLPPRRKLTSMVQAPKVMLRRYAERRRRADAGYRTQEAMMKAYIIFGRYLMNPWRAVIGRRRNHRQT